MTAYLFALGVLLTLTPAVTAFMEGVREDEDLTLWLANKPLEAILLMQAMSSSGIGLVVVSAAMFYWELS